MSILDFVVSPMGALLGKVLMGLTLATMIYVAVSQYNEGIRKTQMLNDQNAQLVQLVKDYKELDRKMTVVSKINNDILVKLDQKNGKIIETHDTVTKYINSPEGQKSNGQPVPDVVKTTIGVLRNAK
jgi:hypothetical protein